MSPSQRAQFIEDISGVHIYRFAREDAGTVRRHTKESVVADSHSLSKLVTFYDTIKKSTDDYEALLIKQLADQESDKATLRQSHGEIMPKILAEFDRQVHLEELVKLLEESQQILDDELLETSKKLESRLEQRGKMQAGFDETDRKFQAAKKGKCDSCGQSISYSKVPEYETMCVMMGIAMITFDTDMELTRRTLADKMKDMKYSQDEVAAVQDELTESKSKLKALEVAKENIEDSLNGLAMDRDWET